MDKIPPKDTKKQSLTVTLLIPNLNELTGMKVIMPRIREDWVDQSIIVDGGSTDGNIEYVRQHKNWLLLEQQRPGLRHAYNEAVPHVTGDIVITFSPDGNSIPELIPDLIEKTREGQDMVIVSRYLAGVPKALTMIY